MTISTVEGLPDAVSGAAGESSPASEGSSSAAPLARYEIHLVAKPNITIEAAKLHVREQTMFFFDAEDRTVAVFMLRNIVGFTVEGDVHGQILVPDDVRPRSAEGGSRAAARSAAIHPDNRSHSIDVYADGSFQVEHALGAWAFVIPALQLKASGCEWGANIQEFELLAVLEGLRALQGRSAARVRVFTDCVATADRLKSLLDARDGQFVRPGACEDAGMAELVDVVRQLNAATEFSVLHPGVNSLWHRECHNLARRTIRQQLKDGAKLQKAQ